MDTRKKLVSVEGLRRADANTLLVLTQDIVLTPLTRLDPHTLCDLLALSEVAEGLPVALARELTAFRERMGREMLDLPDGPVLAEFATDLAGVAAHYAPAAVRALVQPLLEERREAAALEALGALMEHWADVEPTVHVLPVPALAQRPAREVVPARKAPEKNGPRRRIVKVEDDRQDWIQRDVLARLLNYGPAGLKEAMVVAGARHRARDVFPDMTDAEVLAVLRRLKRESAVRHSAGRWMISI